MKEQLTRQQMRMALRKCRFPTHEGWTINAPTTTSGSIPLRVLGHLPALVLGEGADREIDAMLDGL